MCARSKVVIPDLLRKVRVLEAQIQNMELKLREMKDMELKLREMKNVKLKLKEIKVLVVEPKRSSGWKFWWLLSAICVAYIMYIGKE